MNRDDIARWAQEAAIMPPDWGATENQWRSLEAFANLVAAAEREACAKVCDEKVAAEYATGKVDHNEMGWTQACAFTIRERGAP
jgi:hypothetical protein